MNQTVEKWLVVAAFAGWVASLGSLVALAIRAASPAVASRPSYTLSAYASNYVPLQLLKVEPRIAVTQIPMDTSKGYWAESLQNRSTPTPRWIEQRSP